LEIAPNLSRFIESLNKTSYWVAEFILTPSHASNRAKRMIKIIKILDSLIELCNYHSAFGIIFGLNLVSVSRLKKTWELVPEKYSKIFEKISTEYSGANNYKEYRNILKNVPMPCLPFVGIYLSDLTHIEDGNEDLDQNNHINFEKMRLIANTFSEMQQFQHQKKGI